MRKQPADMIPSGKGLCGAVMDGFCDSAFAPVRDAFDACFRELGETGAALCAYVDGRPVVDLRGGEAAPGRPWAGDTLVNVYSVTKPFAAACLLRLVELGRVELDAPVARYWPEFAAAGKAGVLVRWLLTHGSGVLALREPMAPEALFDWDLIVGTLRRETPWWEPGTAHGEHALFYGHLLGEVVRRVDGRSFGRFLREEICGPWALDLHVGLTAEEMARAAEVEGMDAAWRAANGVTPGSLREIALDNPPGLLDPAVVNGAAWRGAEIPAVNGHATARAVARFHAALAGDGALDGARLLSAELARAMRSAQSSGVDRLLGRPVDWGFGVQVEPDGFGMGGIGGSLGFGDAARRIGFGYVTRRLAGHDRALRCLDALAAAL